MLVRRLEFSDTEAMWALRLRALQDSPSAFGSTYEEESQMSDEARLARCVWTDENFVLGAFDADSILVGMAGFRRETRQKSAHKGVVWGMFVAPEARGRGLARALMVELLRLARDLPGLERVILDVVVGNDHALALYESLGFVTYSHEPECHKQDGRYLAMLHMSLRFSEHRQD